MRTRIFIVTLYALAVAFNAVAYRLYLPQYAFMHDRGRGTVQRGTSVTVKELCPENPEAGRLRVGDEVVALDADTVIILLRAGTFERMRRKPDCEGVRLN